MRSRLGRRWRAVPEQAIDRADGAPAKLHPSSRLRVPRRPAPALAQWRLARAARYVDAHLSEPITLADLAASTGLSRMHFAARFRAATGLRPHDYVLRRRIDRAQELLRRPATTIVDAALSVGFQTQAHFTAVFRRFTGATPRRWRKSSCMGTNG